MRWTVSGWRLHREWCGQCVGYCGLVDAAKIGLLGAVAAALIAALLDSELARAMRSVESAVRSALLNPAHAPLDQLRDRANAYFAPREVIRTHMLREVTRFEKPTDPLAGTVFDSRRLPAR